MIFSTFSNILTVMTAFFRGDLSKQWQEQEHIFHVFHGNEADACIIFQYPQNPQLDIHKIQKFLDFALQKFLDAVLQKLKIKADETSYQQVKKSFSKMIFSTFSNILTVMTAFFRGDLSKQWQEQEHIFHVFHGNEADACIIFQLAVPPFARPL